MGYFYISTMVHRKLESQRYKCVILMSNVALGHIRGVPQNNCEHPMLHGRMRTIHFNSIITCAQYRERMTNTMGDRERSRMLEFFKSEYFISYFGNSIQFNSIQFNSMVYSHNTVQYAYNICTSYNTMYK